MKASTAGWTNNDTAAINDATVDEVVEALHSLDRENFGPVIFFYRSEIKTPTQQVGVGSMFKTGAETFLQAARKIVEEDKSSRLIELLMAHLGEQLFPLASAGGQDSDHNPVRA